MERFVLKVDLSEILVDVCHQKVMILVDPQWSTVSDVKNKIKKMFKIDKKIGFKSSDGFFIPLEEPVEILKYVNMLIAFKVGEFGMSEQAQNKNSHLTIGPEIIQTTAEFASKKKRKHGFLNEENFTTSTPNVAKRLKNFSLPQDEVPPETESFKLPEKRNKKKTKTISPDKVLHESNRKTSESASKKKSKLSFIPEVENANSKSENHIFFESNDQVVDDSKANSRLQKSNDELKKSKKEIVFLCELNDSELSGRGRSFQIGKHTTGTEKANNTEKQATLENHRSQVSTSLNNSTLSEQVSENSTNAKSNFTINAVEGKMPCLELTEVSESLMSYDESVIDCNETERIESQTETNLTAHQETENSSVNEKSAECSSVNEKTAECSSENLNNEDCSSVNEKSAECYSIIDTNASELSESYFEGNAKTSFKTVPLTDLPNLNDKLIFKIMLSNNKLSETFVGTCEYVNKRSKSIKIHLTDNHSQIPYLPQKYVGNLDDSRGVTILNVKLQDMLEAKVVQV